MPVGAFDPDRKADCVSKWHYDVYGSIAPARPDGRGGEVLKSACGPGTTLVTGAPLHNLGVAMSLGLEVGEWVAQGGFAGEGVVPRERQLDKFKGMATCPTYNLNGDPKSALTALGYAGIGRRRFVSKNVCHGVFCDQTLGDAIGRRKGVPHLDLIHQGVKAYLGRHPEGKKFHDPLAACCALSPDIGEWAEVELYREKGQWGSRLKPGSGTLIIVGYDHRRFTETLLEARA
jgi:pyrimidine-specific ribonucleoside hydrolase